MPIQEKQDSIDPKQAGLGGQSGSNRANPNRAGSGRVRSSDEQEEFVALLTAEQIPLLYYITMLLGNAQAAQNVLQDTNLSLWRKADLFELGTNFRAWSRAVAYWQVQAYLRDKGRDRHVFGEQLAEQLSETPEDSLLSAERRDALRQCLGEIRNDQVDLLKYRYVDDLPMAAIAKKVGRTEQALRSALTRIRRALLRCIESRA